MVGSMCLTIAMNAMGLMKRLEFERVEINHEGDRDPNRVEFKGLIANEN